MAVEPEPGSRDPARRHGERRGSARGDAGTREPKPRPARAPDHLLIALAVAMALALFVLAAPRLIAALLAMPGESVAIEAHDGAALSAEALILAATDIERAQRWQKSAERESERGFLLARAAEMTPYEPERSRLFDAAETSTALALSLGPQQPGAWARLSSLKARRGDRAGAVAALRLSLLSGPYVPVAMASRLALALSLLPDLDAETRDLVRRDIRLTWIADPGAVAELRAKPEFAAIIAQALDQLTRADFDLAARLRGPR